MEREGSSVQRHAALLKEPYLSGRTEVSKKIATLK